MSCTEGYKVRQLQHRYLLGSRSWTESQAHKDQAIVIGEEAHGRAPLLLSQPEKNRQQTTGIFDRTTWGRLQWPRDYQVFVNYIKTCCLSNAYYHHHSILSSLKFPTQTQVKLLYILAHRLNMRSTTIFSVAITALSFFATTTSAWCDVKKFLEDCCLRDDKARHDQGNGFADGDFCNAEILKTCDADCCSMSTGLGIGCPK